MTYCLRHRGPDGDGFYNSINSQFKIPNSQFASDSVACVLGHRRLAIIDPEGGRQPIGNEDGSVQIVLNGEIYNFRELRRELESLGHRFQTNSDVEAVVHGYEVWGDEVLKRLRGMFAFALWDARRERLLLARDRVGIKPLVYRETPGGLAFASEIQALRTLPDFDSGVDLSALDLYLHFQYIPAPFSIYRSVRKLPPAHYLTWDRRAGLRGPHRYWKLEFRPKRNIREEEWLETLDSALKESVEAHLVSDVPFGAFLSGGVDSSTVVAYMSGLLDRPVETFSIGFEEAPYDERRYAREASALFGTEHHEEIVRPDAMECLPTLVRHYGEPFADSSAIPTYYVSRLASRHVKMVLSGDGGDENFAGYSTYAAILDAVPKPKTRLRRARHRVGNVLRSLGLRPAIFTSEDLWFDRIAYFDRGARERLWRGEHAAATEASRRWFDGQLAATRSPDLATRFQALDLSTYLPYDILTKVDVASMCHGLEVRVPLLDHRLMELVATIPSELKLRRSPGEGGAPTGKYLLKRNAEKFFSREFIHRPKMGFGAPVSEWFRGPLAGRLEEIANDPRLEFRELFNGGYVRELIAEHRAGRDHGYRLWALTFLAEWFRQAAEPASRPAEVVPALV